MSLELDHAKPTGSVRFRTERSLLGREKLILQIEVAYMVPLRPMEVSEQRAWRDATMKDISKNTIKPEKLA